MKRITLGGGCFWCLEAVFKNVKGVLKVVPGYSGGHVKNPTYKQVCQGNTGHAEVIDITYDDTVITLQELLSIFFFVHDPTTRNRQGNDVGHQYRSIILYHDDEQRKIIEDYIKRLPSMEIFKSYEEDEITTEVVPFGEFFEAEDYHHNYFENNPSNPYCSFVIKPKIMKFMDKFSKILKI